jgi:hypothetical protein
LGEILAEVILPSNEGKPLRKKLKPVLPWVKVGVQTHFNVGLQFILYVRHSVIQKLLKNIYVPVFCLNYAIFISSFWMTLWRTYKMNCKPTLKCVCTPTLTLGNTGFNFFRNGLPSFEGKITSARISPNA